MATYTAHSAIGQREDLTDLQSPLCLPIRALSMTSAQPRLLSCPRLARRPKLRLFEDKEPRVADTFYDTKATVFHAAATTANAAVEGADASDATLSPTVRLGNYTQIMQKTIKVSGTLDTVNKAGRKSEKAYQLAKASQEIKRDLETVLLSNQGRSAGDGSTARKMASLLSWIKTNSSAQTNGGDPTTIGVSTRTDGNTRTFTEALLKEVVAEVFVSGGSPKSADGRCNWQAEG
jgi:hypothetical protein